MAALKFIIFDQEAPHFHFALGPTDEVADSAAQQWRLMKGPCPGARGRKKGRDRRPECKNPQGRTLGILQHRQCRKSWVGPRGFLGAGGLLGTTVFSTESQRHVIGQGVHETTVKKVAVVGRKKEGTDSRNQDREEWSKTNIGYC